MFRWPTERRACASHPTQMSPSQKQVVPLNYVAWQLVTHSLFSSSVIIFQPFCDVKITERLRVNATTLNLDVNTGVCARARACVCVCVCDLGGAHGRMMCRTDVGKHISLPVSPGGSGPVLIGGPGWGQLFLLEGHIQPGEKRQILHSDKR